MTDPRSIIRMRRYGEVRCSVVSEHTGELSRVLSKVGLTPDASLLEELNREMAVEILKALLWKDMAYENECMAHETAESLAREIVEQHAYPGSRYFSNGNWTLRESWNPLTPATFDGGILISGEGGQWFCIWFEDED